MNLEVTFTGPGGQVCCLDPYEAKTYIFIEATPVLIKLFPLARPDEHQGARCISFVLDSDEAVEQAIRLTHAVMEGLEGGTS